MTGYDDLIARNEQLRLACAAAREALAEAYGDVQAKSAVSKLSDQSVSKSDTISMAGDASVTAC